MLWILSKKKKNSLKKSWIIRVYGYHIGRGRFSRVFFVPKQWFYQIGALDGLSITVHFGSFLTNKFFSHAFLEDSCLQSKFFECVLATISCLDASKIMSQNEHKRNDTTKTTKEKRQNNTTGDIAFRHMVSSVGRALVCWAGGCGFKSRPDQQSGFLKELRRKCCLCMTTANG